MSSTVGISKAQALFRGHRSRKLHVERAKSGCSVICPFVACSRKIAEDFISLAKLTSVDTVYDLGSGDGAIITEVASKVGCKCVGIEIDPVLCDTAKRRVVSAGIGHLVSVRNEDLETISEVEGNVIFLFLTPTCLPFIVNILKKCPIGTKIVCYMFPLPEWTPLEVVATEDMVNTKNSSASGNLYYYII